MRRRFLVVAERSLCCVTGVDDLMSAEVPLFLRPHPTSYEQHHRQAHFILAYLFRRFTGIVDFDVIRSISHNIVRHELALRVASTDRFRLRKVLQLMASPNLENGCPMKCLRRRGVYAQCPWCKACCCVRHAPRREAHCCEEAAKAKYSWLLPSRWGMALYM